MLVAYCCDCDNLKKTTLGGHELDEWFCVASEDYLGLVW